MKDFLIEKAITLLLGMIDVNRIRAALDNLLDQVEASHADDPHVLQALGLVRGLLAVPDDIGGDAD